MAPENSPAAGMSPGLMALLAAAAFEAAASVHFQSPMLGATALEFGADAMRSVCWPRCIIQIQTERSAQSNAAAL